MASSSPSAFKRGVECYDNAEALAEAAQKLVGTKDDRVIADTTRRIINLTSAPLHNNNHQGAEEDITELYLQRLGPLDLAREAAAKAEEQYGNAKRHFDITVIEAVGGGGGESQAAAQSYLDRITTQVAAIQLFAEVQVPGPSYYRKRARSKPPQLGGSTNGAGLGGSYKGMSTNVGGFIHPTAGAQSDAAHPQPSINTPTTAMPPPIALGPMIEDLERLVVEGGGVGANTNKKVSPTTKNTTTGGSGGNNKDNNFDDFFSPERLTVPNTRLGDDDDSSSEDDDDHKKKTSRKGSTRPTSNSLNASSSANTHSARLLGEDDPEGARAVADDYFALITSTTTPTAAKQAEEQARLKQQQRIQQQQPATIGTLYDGPVMGLPIVVTKEQPPTVDDLNGSSSAPSHHAASAAAHHSSSEQGYSYTCTLPPTNQPNATTTGSSAASSTSAMPTNAYGGYSYDPTAHASGQVPTTTYTGSTTHQQQQQPPANYGSSGYSYDPSAHHAHAVPGGGGGNGGYSYTPPATTATSSQQQHQYDPMGVYSANNRGGGVGGGITNTNAGGYSNYRYDPNLPASAQQQQHYQQQYTPQPMMPPTPSAPTPYSVPSSHTSTNTATTATANNAAADNYLDLLAGAMVGVPKNGAPPTAAAATAPKTKASPTSADEYLAILGQLAQNKKKAQQLALEEMERKAARSKQAADEAKKKPSDGPAGGPPAPINPPATGGGGGGKPAAGGAPPPMSTAFKSLIADMGNIGSVTADGTGGLSGNAINARNAAHTLSAAGANYAPKTSQFVLKGIDVSAQLKMQGQYKKAVDILQHVFDQGKLETHNTRTFEASMTAAILDTRRTYYEKHPPRLLQVNPISDEEMKILQTSGKTSTAFFPMWDDVTEGYAAENVYYPTRPVATAGGVGASSGIGLSLKDAAPWEDPFAPHLSDKQRRAGARWIRAPILLAQFADKDAVAASPTPTADAAALGTAAPPTPATIGLITTCDPLAIKQTIVGDCSLVCSLIVCASFQRRFQQGKIISHVIFPQESVAPTTTVSGGSDGLLMASNNSTAVASSSHLNAHPVINAAGKYCVKMLVNGITRMVVVDDRLPAVPGNDKHYPILACSYSTDPREMWVSLMEKAFVKVCGGTYDFPGSNSSTDLYHLSGWLPDYLALDSSNFNASFQWQRLAYSHRRGALLATLNTPANMHQQTAEKLKLIPGHAYAILDMRETTALPTRPSYKLVKIKNPWTKDNSWEGQFSPNDTERMTPDLRNELGYTDAEVKRGVFWMCWDDVVRYFSRVHLSWNPYCLFSSGPNGGFVKPTRIARHGVWNYTNAMTQKPQFDIICKNAIGRNTRLHLVLSRHIINLDEYNIKAGKRNVNPNDDGNGNGLGVFDECPQARPANVGVGGNSGEIETPDPADYVPLLTVHIYETTAYPSVAQTVISQEPQGSYCGGGKWPAEGSQTILTQLHAEDKGGRTVTKTPLATVIERLPTIPGSVGVPQSVLSAIGTSNLTSKVEGLKGTTHMTTSFTGRRIENQTQLPTGDGNNSTPKGVLVHNGIYKNVPHQTISFDCPPSYGSEVRRFTVVVSQLLPKSERDPKPGAPPAKFPALRTFPFSLTLHSELPMLDKDTSAALLTRAANLPQGIKDRSFINMTALPMLGQLPFVTRAKGHWIGGMNCGGKVGLKTFGYNPQFLLTIPNPPGTAAGGSGSGDAPQRLTHLIAKVTSAAATETVQIHVVALKDAISAMITQQQQALAQQQQGSGPSATAAGAIAIPPWYGRLYTITDDEAKFVLSAERYGWQTAVVDTSLQQCLQFDDTDSLKREHTATGGVGGGSPSTPTAPSSTTNLRGSPTSPPPPPTGPPRLLPVAIKVAGAPNVGVSAQNSSFFSPFPRQKNTLALLPLIADGVLATPLLSRAVFGGQQLPLSGADGNASNTPTIAQTPSAAALITPASAAVAAKLGEVFNATTSESTTVDNTVKMMNNAGTNASILQLITVIPSSESVSAYLRSGTSAASKEMSELWLELIRLAQRVLAQFAAWYGCGSWAEAVAVLPEASFQTQSLPTANALPSLLCANQYLRRRFGAASNKSSSVAPLEHRNKAEYAVKLLSEEVLKTITKLDKHGIDTGDDEAMRGARRALVAIAQHVLHEATDELARAFGDVDRNEQQSKEGGGGQQIVAVTPPATGNVQAVSVPPAAPSLHRLPPGQYIVAVSQWTSGTPSPFELAIETEVPHILTELPPEGSDAAPADPTPGSSPNALVGYRKWHNLNISGTFTNHPSGSGAIRASALYDRPMPLGGHPIFQTYPSISIFIPSNAAPLTLTARILISAPADANDTERSLPAGALASGQLLLFTEPPDGNAILIGDSGDDASAVDISLTMTNNKNLANTTPIATGGSNTKVFGGPCGSTRINYNTATFVGGRKYRLVLMLRPAVSFRQGAQMQFTARVFCSTAGTTATLSAK